MIKKFSTWLNEDKGTHSYGCAMLYTNFSLKDIHELIDKDDVYNGKKGDDRSYGLENNSHVTLLYGLHKEVEPSNVIDICMSYLDEAPEFTLHNVSLFSNDDYDVLKFDVKCRVLHKINKELMDLPNSNEFPKYHPHMTIAYLKPGMGKKYTEKFKDYEYDEIVPTKIVYSSPDKKKVEKHLKQPDEDKS